MDDLATAAWETRRCFFQVFRFFYQHKFEPYEGEIGSIRESFGHPNISLQPGCWTGGVDLLAYRLNWRHPYQRSHCSVSCIGGARVWCWSTRANLCLSISQSPPTWSMVDCISYTENVCAYSLIFSSHRRWPSLSSSLLQLYDGFVSARKCTLYHAVNPCSIG